MAESTADLQSLIRSNFCFLDVDPHLELITQFSGTSSPISVNHVIENSSLLDSFSSDNLCGNPAPDQLPRNLAEIFPGKFGSSYSNNNNQLYATNNSSVENSLGIVSSTLVSETGTKKRNGSGKRKSVKSNDKEEEKSPKEVVHIRARRGQATSNHSLAERARRGKINERLRCLQAIVPGCYKPMGIAVMLDEIINYVHSLQNQVEFLSMKLTAASAFYDFNSQTAAIERMQCVWKDMDGFA